MTGDRLEEVWSEGQDFGTFLAGVEKNRDLWHALYRRARAAREVVEAARARGPCRLLVIADDWCGDAVNTIPLIAHLVEEVDTLDLRIVGRDDHPQLMDAHLTGTARSIPVVIAMDEAYRELGWWGPRPEPLQKWVLDVGLSLPKEERYRQVRTWYARDRGATTLAEILALLDHARDARVA